MTALPLLRRNILDWSRELCMSCGINGPVLDPGARRVFIEEVVTLPVLRWPDGPRNKPTATVRTDVTQDTVNACYAERTFVSANACFERIRWQGLVAVFAGRAEFEHRVLSRRLTLALSRGRAAVLQANCKCACNRRLECVVGPHGVTARPDSTLRAAKGGRFLR